MGNHGRLQGLTVTRLLDFGLLSSENGAEEFYGVSWNGRYGLREQIPIYPGLGLVSEVSQPPALNSLYQSSDGHRPNF